MTLGALIGAGALNNANTVIVHEFAVIVEMHFASPK